MQALRWHGIKDLRLENIEQPAALPGKVKIKVEWCGICGSDLHEYVAGPIFIPENAQHPLTGEKSPIVMGHEFSGQFFDFGEGVTKIQVGDREVVEPVFACGECDACRQGKYNLCDKMGFLGLAGGGGGFSEYVAADEHMVHKIPESVSFEQGALVEPSAVALYAVRQIQLKVDDKAVVFGAGPIGLLVIEALNASGASEIYAEELSEERTAKAEDLGAIVLDPNTYDVVEELHKRTNGGVYVPYEVTEVPPVLTQAIESAKISGEIMIVIIFEKEALIKPNNIVMNERNLTGLICYDDVFPALISLMENGYFPADKLVIKRIKLVDVIEAAFESLLIEEYQVTILVSPHA
uniref:2,3-butanediol dehydrogenase n=1 Tax=Paenibacillus polymyxa TaxID=1406 RepID=G9HPK4_PAEPO|nr:2,3-butanediol dehydrogenase [Paenibacillus polymyxa]